MPSLTARPIEIRWVENSLGDTPLAQAELRAGADAPKGYQQRHANASSSKLLDLDRLRERRVEPEPARAAAGRYCA